MELAVRVVPHGFEVVAVRNRAAVHAFHAATLANGARDIGAPGPGPSAALVTTGRSCPIRTYGFSVLYCMTTSLAHGGAGLGTCGCPPSVVTEPGHRAGFTAVPEVPIDNPLNRLYALSP